MHHDNEIVLQVGEARVHVPAHAAAMAYLDKFTSPFDGPTPTAIIRSVPRPHGSLPTVGEKYEGGIYAGPTLHDGQLKALIVLLEDAGPLKWQAALDWAGKQGGELPTRIDGLVLFKALKSAFKPEYYWTSEPSAGNGDYAWYQDFTNGLQHYWHKDSELRARAVRRLIIE